MKYFRPLITFTSLILLWQLVVSLLNLPPYILPTPLAVWHALLTYKWVLLNELAITASETILGLFLGILIGCLIALLMLFFKPFFYWFFPLLVISQALPTFAIAPLLVMWFGFGMQAKIMTTVLMIFFPITSSFYDGLTSTNPAWLEMANSMQAKKLNTFLIIQLPAALPALFSGLRVATAIAPIGAIVGEWVGASQGLGFLMLNSNERMQIDLMFAALFCLILFSLLLYTVVNFILKRLILCVNLSFS